MLPNLNDQEIDKIEADLYEFIWRGPSPMSRDEAKMPKEQGGLGMTCLRSTWKSVKVSWIRRITFNTNTNWYKVLQAKINTFANIDLSNILEWSTHNISIVATRIDSNIWKSIFQSWKDTIIKDVRANPDKLLTANPWGMQVLKRENGRTIKYEHTRELERANVIPLQLIEKRAGATVWTTRNAVETRQNIGRNLVTLGQINMAMEATRVLINSLTTEQIDIHATLPYRPYNHGLILRNKKGSNNWKQILRSTERGLNKITQREYKWEDVVQRPLLKDFWQIQYEMAHKLSFDNRIKLNHILFLKHNLKLNYQVANFRPEVQPQCTLYNREVEKPKHIFFNCPVTTALRETVNNNLMEWTEGEPFTCIENILFTQKAKGLKPRFALMVLMKEFVWKNRCNKTPGNVNFENLKSFMRNILAPHKRAGTVKFLNRAALTNQIDL